MTKRQAEEIKELASTPDDEIDTSDIPEVKDWSQAEVSKFYRPLKKPVTIRPDAHSRQRR